MPRTLTIILAISLFSRPSFSATTTLYDDGGGTPGSQPWLLYADDGILFGGSATESATASGVQLTTDAQVRGGYSNYLPSIPPFTPLLKNDMFPVLERATGFSLEFQLQIASEAHTSDDRAGFSVIALSSDGLGIELGFWQDEIWAQSASPLFTHAEGVNFDTTAAEVGYRLTISGNSYELFANNISRLNGTLRDYSGFGGPPYTLGSYLFLGDDTTSAAATANLGRITVTTLVPEPNCCVPWAILYLMLLARPLLSRGLVGQVPSIGRTS